MSRPNWSAIANELHCEQLVDIITALGFDNPHEPTHEQVVERARQTSAPGEVARLTAVIEDYQESLGRERARAVEYEGRVLALQQALDVPEGADPAEWARALADAGAICERAAVGMALFEDVEERGRALDALRTPPRALPDGRGWWWGSYNSEPMRPVWVEVAGDGRHTAIVLCDNSSTWLLVDATGSDAWTWLTGPDGKAVRCTPPVGGGE